MKIKMPLEKALFCPKHGRQIYYTACFGSKMDDKWCNRTNTDIHGTGEVIALVAKGGKVYNASERTPKNVWKTAEIIVHSECFRTLSERMVMPKFEELLGRRWRYEWGSKIWSCVPNMKLRVSQNGPGKTWHVYYPQYNTEEYNKLHPNKQPKVWRGRFKSRIAAMKAAIENWETIEHDA